MCIVLNSDLQDNLKNIKQKFSLKSPRNIVPKETFSLSVV